MERYSVVLTCVDAFDYIHLACIGPIWSQQPVCWPTTTSSGHVVEVEDEETVQIGVAADDANTGPTKTTRGPQTCQVRLYPGGSLVCCRCIAILESHRLVDVLNVSIGRIVGAVEHELVEKALRIVIVDQSIRGRARRAASLNVAGPSCSLGRCGGKNGEQKGHCPRERG